MRLLRWWTGTLLALGFDPAASLTIDPFPLISEEIVVTGTRYATRAEIAQTLELVRQRRVGAAAPMHGVRRAASARKRCGRRPEREE